MHAGGAEPSVSKGPIASVQFLIVVVVLNSLSLRAGFSFSLAVKSVHWFETYVF